MKVTATINRPVVSAVVKTVAADKVWKKIYTGKVTASSILNPGERLIATLNIGTDAYDLKKLVYVQIVRRSVGIEKIFRRSDSFYMPLGDGPIMPATIFSRFIYPDWGQYTAKWGVYPGEFAADGSMNIYSNYDAEETGALLGEYSVTVWVADYPGGDLPYQEE